MVEIMEALQILSNLQDNEALSTAIVLVAVYYIVTKKLKDLSDRIDSKFEKFEADNTREHDKLESRVNQVEQNLFRRLDDAKTESRESMKNFRAEMREERHKLTERIDDMKD